MHHVFHIAAGVDKLLVKHLVESELEKVEESLTSSLTHSKKEIAHTKPAQHKEVPNVTAKRIQQPPSAHQEHKPAQQATQPVKPAQQATQPVKPTPKAADVWGEFQLLNTKKNQQIWDKWKQLVRSTVHAEIKKLLNCQQIRLLRVFIRKALSGYIYWIHYAVQEIGNAKIGTIMLLEREDTLQIVDIMQGEHLAVKIVHI